MHDGDLHLMLNQLRQRGDQGATGVGAPNLSTQRTTADRCSTLASSVTVSEWLAADVSVPDWCDLALAREGQEVFQRWALPMCAALFCASLPFAYAAAEGATQLRLISDLAGRQVHKRLAETTQMLLDVHEPNRNAQLFASDSDAARTLRRVRLLHEYSRQKIIASHASVPMHSAPINQEDLLGTLLSFTVVVFDALERLGVQLSIQERSALLSLWALVGHHLGVEAAHLTVDIATATELRKCIADRNHAHSDAGVALAAALVGTFERVMPLGMRSVPRTFIWHAGGPDVARILGLDKPGWWAFLLPPFAAMGRRQTTNRVLRRIGLIPLKLLAAPILRSFVDVGLDGGEVWFRLSPEQQKQWGVRGLGPRRSALRRRRQRLRQARP
jgi:ER-bound oxygenase mpaB/B'/Rubber oxygenase, catalytic domain